MPVLTYLSPCAGFCGGSTTADVIFVVRVCFGPALVGIPLIGVYALHESRGAGPALEALLVFPLMLAVLVLTVPVIVLGMFLAAWQPVITFSILGALLAVVVWTRIWTTLPRSFPA